VGDRLASMSEPCARGRSFRDGAADQKPDAVLYGYNFEEQWRRVFEIDPEFVFITGWNEWVAMRLNEFNGVQAPVIFVDEFDQEHSRDIEPMRGGHGDNYYYQMIANIRRFKGVRPQPAAGPPKTIAIDGDFGDWQDVTPEYRDHTGDPVFRDHPGWGTAGRFLNRSGRNDFAVLKVARDAENFYFYARTRNYISLRVEPHWMMLFLDTDRDHETGWEGFDFVLNRVTPPTHACILERAGGDFACAPAGQAAYAVKEKELELAIPRAALGLTADTPLDIEFKWADNIMREGNIAEFTVNGDAAPPGRFNYRYFELDARSGLPRPAPARPDATGTTQRQSNDYGRQGALPLTQGAGPCRHLEQEDAQSDGVVQRRGSGRRGLPVRRHHMRGGFREWAHRLGDRYRQQCVAEVASAAHDHPRRTEGGHVQRAEPVGRRPEPRGTHARNRGPAHPDRPRCRRISRGLRRRRTRDPD